MFLAFAYFMIGQAALTRNSAQTAADAAALAAAQDAREQLRMGWLGVVLDPAQWDRFREGKEYGESSACGQAAAFASRNGAKLVGDDCVRLAGEREGFRVTVETTGTEERHATASAMAVIEPKCDFEAPEAPFPEDPGTDPGPAEPSEEPESVPITGLTCDGDPVVIDPDQPKLPSAADLFAVRLTGDDE